MLSQFANEPMTDFSRPENRRAMEAALCKIDGQLGREYPLIIGGDRIDLSARIQSINPSKKAETIGFAAKAGVEQAERAMRAAIGAFGAWRFVPSEDRARCLFKAAAIMRRRKFEFSAWLVLEAGKTWAEADADTAEAIDFMEFYGREAIRLAEPKNLTRLVGEDNELYYIPLGVGVVIPPWNFPLAILAGMTVAAVVTGNTVILKPASATPIIAAKFVELMEEAGLPPGVINYVPGSGGEIGDYLVTHPQTRFISFTGSREVGVRIIHLAGEDRPGQKWIKRVTAEMGGKDAVIVDSQADLDDAAQAIVSSAFGFQGQKCSACSRAIVVRDVYDKVLELVAEKTKQIAVGPARDPGVFMGPVIDEAASRKILQYIKIGLEEGRLVLGGGPGSDEGYFIQPTIFADVDSRSRLGQEEIFGPVLAVIKADDFDQAIALANDTEYGLTGAVFSRNRQKLERARREFHVGNLYFNRKCTGALVGVHPFGGFNMSGTDSKAGGYDYLLLFTQAKLVSEKL